MLTISIVQRFVVDYRVPFYSGLQERLARHGIDLKVYAGAPPAGLGFIDGLPQLAFGRRLAEWAVAPKIYLQRPPRDLIESDLVVVEQANGALLNYRLFLGRYVRHHPKRVAYWGHGATFQSGDTGPLRTAWKRWMSSLSDHWFAYTEASRARLLTAGVDPGKITVVNNSIDLSDISAAAAARGPRRAGARPSAVFCSRLYTGKRLEFLLEAADLIRARLPGFELTVIGEGPERPAMEAAAARRPWLHVVGPLYGQDKATALAAADVLLIPAWLGLTILDGFAAGLPCISAAFEDHSPEIAYLDVGVNGLISAPTAEAYAEAVIGLLSDNGRLSQMRDAAFKAAARYSMSSMIEAFELGVLHAMSSFAGAA